MRLLMTPGVILFPENLLKKKKIHCDCELLTYLEINIFAMHNWAKGVKGLKPTLPLEKTAHINY